MAIASVASVALVPAGNSGGTSSAIDTTGANLLVVSVGWFGTVTVSDSKSNTWIGLTTRNVGTEKGRLFYCLGGTVGSGHTFTISGSGIYAAATVHAFSGVAGYQIESGAPSTGATQPVASGSVTPLTNGALVVTTMTAGATPATDAISPGGFTQITAPGVTGTTLQVSTGYYIQPTAAAINPTWSWTGTHSDVVVGTAVFLASLPVTSPLVAYVRRGFGALGGPWSVPANGGTTDPVDTTGANLLVVSVGCFGGATVSVSDSKANTWFALTKHTGSQADHRIYYAKNATVGTGHTFTVTASGGYPGVVVYAFSGADPTAPFDTENGAGTSSSSGPLSTGSITPSGDGAYIVSGLQYGNGSNTSITVTTALTSNVLITDACATAYTVQATAAAINPAWSWSGSTQGAAVSIAAFKVPGTVAAGDIRLTNVYAEALTQATTADLRLTNLYAEALTQAAAADVRLTNVYAEVLQTYVPPSYSTRVVTGSGGGTSLPVDATGARLFVASVSQYAAGAAATVSDSRGNTWTALTYRDAGDAGHRFFYVSNPLVSNAQTFTVAGSSIYCVATFYAFSDFEVFDAQNGATATTGASLATGSVTPSVDGALVISGWAGMNLAINPTVDAGLTKTTSQNSVAGTCISGAAAYKVQTTAASISPIWSWSGTDHVAEAVVVFKPAAGPPPPTEPRVTQLVVETITHATPEARVSQLVVEALTKIAAPVTTRVSQLVVETVTQGIIRSDAHITQVAVETITKLVADPSVSQLLVETATDIPPPFLRVSQSPLELLTAEEDTVRVSQAALENIQVFAAEPTVAHVSQAPLENVQGFTPTLVYGRVSQMPLEIIYPFGCYQPPTPPCTASDFPVDDVPAGGSCPTPFPTGD